MLLLALVTWVLYRAPALRLIPPERIAGPINAPIPQLGRASFATAEHAALAERGRYVFSVGGCSFCHGATGAGGLKVSWRAFGTRWVRNITSDSATGLGAWSDAEVARAIRGGVARGGRMLHWQAMIWDHASNWDEQDLRALVAYLRTLPPVPNEVPAAQPPQQDDCPIYSFWIADSRRRGCE